MDITVCIPTVRSKEDLQSLLTEIARDVPNNKILLSYAKPLTKARTELINQVTTKYFVFLDDDIIYKKGLIRLLYDAITTIKCKKMGAIQGSTQPNGFGKKWDIALQNTIKDIQKVSFGKRFMTSNAIIVTDSVKDWLPNANVSGCEDWHLTNFLLKNGYSIYIIPANLKHRSSFTKIKSNARWFAKGFVNVFGPFQTLKYILKLSLGIVKALVTFPNNWRRSMYIIYQNTFVVKNLSIEVFRKTTSY